MKLIVGLGNPGRDYMNTRHNFGFMAVDNYASKNGAQWQVKTKFNAEIAIIGNGDERTILAKPQTYYNLSGNAVMQIMSFYRIERQNVMVIHDEMALPLGTMRTRLGGSDAGNNGIRHIINTIGAEFARIRIGSGKTPTKDGDAQPTNNRRDYVLSGLNRADTDILNREFDTVNNIIDNFVNDKFIETTYRLFIIR